MKELFKKVGEFNTAMQISENKRFGALPSPAESQLSFNLIQEELQEYNLAMKEYNRVEVADGLIDMLYLVIGAMRRHGLSESKAMELFNEVHASNMSKVLPCGSVIKRADGKVLKPEGYFKPDLLPILDK